MEKLSAVSAAEANAVANGTGRSVAQLVAHMIAWRQYALERMTSDLDLRIEIGGPIDWPGHDALPSWPELLSELTDTQERLLSLLSTHDDTWLDTLVPGTQYRYGFLISGIIDHDVYHLGQIGLVLRMVRQQS